MQSEAALPQSRLDLGDDGEIARRLDAVYSRQGSHLDGTLAAAQAEALREEW